MVIGFMLAFYENPDKILDSIHSTADVYHLIAERNECGKSQKAEDLTKECMTTSTIQVYKIM